MVSLGWVTRALRRISGCEPAGFVRSLVSISMQRALVFGAMLASLGFLMTMATVIPWLFGDRQHVAFGDVLVAGISLAICGTQLIAVSWCREMVDVSVNRESVGFTETAQYTSRVRTAQPA